MANIGYVGAPTQVAARIVGGRPVIPYTPVGSTKKVERNDTPDGFEGAFKGSKMETWDECSLRKGFTQPTDEPSDLDHALAEASAGIQCLRLESARLSKELLKKMHPDDSPAPDLGVSTEAPGTGATTEVFNNVQWQAQLRAVPTATIDVLPRKGRIALLEAGVQAAAAEEGNLLCPAAARRNIPLREDAIVLAATKRGLLERPDSSTIDTIENVTGLAMGSGLGVASARLAEERRLAEQTRCGESKEWRRRIWASGLKGSRHAASAEPCVKLGDSAVPTDSLDDEAWIEQRRARRRSRREMRKEEHEMHWPAQPYVRADVTWPPFKQYHEKIVVPAPQTEIVDVPLPAFLTGSSRLCRLAKQGHWGSLLGKPTERLTVTDKLGNQESPSL